MNTSTGALLLLPQQETGFFVAANIGKEDPERGSKPVYIIVMGPAS